MKNSYLRVTDSGFRPWLLAVFLWTLLAPQAGKAQTFTESMGTTATEGQSVLDYEAALGFDNDSERGFNYLTFAGPPLPVLSVANPSTSGSGGANILFSNGTANSIFGIANVSTAGISAGGTLTFQLNAPAGAFTGTTILAGNARFRVQYAIGTVNPANGNVSYGSYTNLAYAYSAGAAGGWGTATVTLPSVVFGNPLVSFRFFRVGGAPGEYRLDDVALNGTAVAAVTADPNNLDFGDVILGQNSAVQSIRVSGQDLTANLVVTAPAGYQIREFNTGAYRQTVTLAPVNGIVVSTRLQVRFRPMVAGASNDVITVTSAGAATAEVTVSGNATAPVLSATPTSLAFGSVLVGQNSAPQGFTVTGSNLVDNITVTAPAGFQIREGSTGSFVQTLTLTPNAADNTINSTLQARFSPTVAGTFNSAIQITTTSASTQVAVSGTANPVPTGPFIVTSPNPVVLDFGQVTGSGSAQTLTFEISAGNLQSDLVLTGSNNNIVFRDAAAGGSFINGPLVIARDGNNAVASRTIEVRLVPTVASGSFTGTITASSLNATSAVVSIQANSTGATSVINTSGNINTTFSTVPGVPSAVQSYTLSGTNLLRDISVTAPNDFQVSLDPNFTGITITGNSIIVARNSGADVTATTVYVRFFPQTAFTTSANVLNVSSPALSVAVRVAGTSEPSIQLENAFQRVERVEIFTRSAVQTLNVRAERVLQPVTISQLLSTNTVFNNSRVPQFEFSRDNVNFTTDTIKLRPNASTFTINQPIYVRYRPTNLGDAKSTLQYQSNDFSNRSVQSFASNELLSGLPIDNEPTQRSTATVSRSGATATISFNLPPNYIGLGYGEGRLIVASENPTLPSSNQPTDGVSYQTGNQTYGVGPQVAAGYFSVFAGPNQSVTIDGLNPAKTYYFYTFEFNNIDNVVNVIANGAENYLQPPVPTTIPGIEAPGNPPLPVSLVAFSAKLRNKRVELNWETASELNNKGFEVQRSQDGRSFTTILTREGKGTTSQRSSYEAVDAAPLAGTSYYRLKQVDVDGKTSFSNPVTVVNLVAGQVKMYPNPVYGKLTIETGGAVAGLKVQIADMTGRSLRTQTVDANGQVDMSGLQAGTYFITVGEGANKTTQRVVKQ